MESTVTNELPLSEMPRLLYLKCNQCNKFRRAESIKVGVAQEGSNKGKRIVYGPCVVCGSEAESSIATDIDAGRVAQRSVDMYNREQQRERRREERRQGKGKQVIMARIKKASTKAVASKGKAPAKRASKAAVATAANGRSVKWGSGPEGVTGIQSFALSLSGGMHTLAEWQERHNALAKAGKVKDRLVPIVTSDGTWMVKNGAVDIDGKAVTIYRGTDGDGNTVFGAPELADALKKGSRAGRVTSRNGRMVFSGIELTTDGPRSGGSTKKAAKATAKTKKVVKASRSK